MSTTPIERPSVPLRVSTAEEIRVWLTRRRMTGVALAARIGRSQSYVSRRLTGETAFDVDDLERIALALSVTVRDLLPQPTGTTPVNSHYPSNGTSRHPDKRPAGHPGGSRRPVRTSPPIIGQAAA